MNTASQQWRADWHARSKQRIADRAKESSAPKPSEDHPLLLNVYRHNGQSGRPLGHSYDEYTGPHAMASAAEDARYSGHNDGLMRYVETLILRSDGTYSREDLS